MKILVTGNCGFIGQNFVRMYKDKHKIIGVDKLGYASDKRALKLCHTLCGKLQDKEFINNVFKYRWSFDAIVHFAANSHVDNSINSPEPFMYDNYMGTFQLLECARRYNVPRFLITSSDEVYGDLQLNDPPFSNLYEMKPSSPYSASKAAADMLVMAYNRTYSMNTIITRSCNNYGPYQYKEKLIPVVIMKALANEKIPVYGTGMNMREWITVGDNCRGIMATLQNGKSGGIYNLGSGTETTNLNIVKTILDILGKPHSLIEMVTDRKGHDFRYFLDSKKTHKLGWHPAIGLTEGLKKTVEWYKDNPTYWEKR